MLSLFKADLTTDFTPKKKDFNHFLTDLKVYCRKVTISRKCMRTTTRILQIINSGLNAKLDLKQLFLAFFLVRERRH